MKEYAKAKYGWLDIPDTTYGANASSDDDSISDDLGSTTPNISPKQQTAILPDNAVSSIVTMVETNISQSSQHQKHPKKVLIKMEEQEEQLATSEGPKVVPKKSSTRKHTTAIKIELAEYSKDKTPDLSLEENNNTITIIKGSKTKPGMLSMKNISDYRLGRNVAFDLGSDVGLNLN